MANTDNKCHDLEINNLFGDIKSNNDTLSHCFDFHKKMQKDTYGYDFENMTIGEVVDFAMKNKHALDDEICEYFDALGGINDGVGNGGWKWWKSSNKEIRSKKLSDLSERDKIELKMEFIDMFIFMMNFAIVINMSPAEVYNMYFSKADENNNRQLNNY